MNSCPYCGESLTDGAVQCSRCGMMLDEDGSAASTAPEEAAPAKGGAKAGGGKNDVLGKASAEAAARFQEPPKVKTELCPKCDKPVKVTAHRCPSCGMKMRDVVSDETREREAAFQRTVRLGVAGVVVVLLIVIGVIGLSGRGGRPKNVEYAKVKFEEIITLAGPWSKGTAERQRDQWLKLGGKWVRWEGRVLDIERGGLFSEAALLLRHREGKGDADVRVTMPKEEIEKQGVGVGAKVAYTARLRAYDGDPAPYVLDMGQVVGAKD